MRYAILADIHGNLEALQEVIRFCEAQGIKDVLCLGDIVGYGANPKECLQLITDLKIPCVAGNHDWAAGGRLSPDYFSSPARAAILWTQKRLAPREKDYLNSLALVARCDEFILVHGTLDNPEEFHYLLDIAQAEDSFAVMDRAVCFVGHTHIPQAFIKKNDELSYERHTSLSIEPKKKYLINIGSVGQPRDGNPHAAFGVYDTETNTVSIQRLAYDIKKAQQKILAAGLPQILATRLSFGQ